MSEISVAVEGDQVEREGDVEQHAPMNRRDLLRMGLVGGVGVLVTREVTGSLAESRAESRLEAAVGAARSEAQVALQTTEARYQARIERLEKELALYEAMDDVGLDRLIDGVLDTYESVWLAVRLGILSLKRGIDWLDETLERFETALSTLRQGSRTVGGILGAVDHRLERVQQLIAEALERSGPVGQVVQELFEWFFSLIPFRLGGAVVDAVEQVTGLVDTVPAVVESTNDNLLKPLDEDWLGAEEGQGIEAGLFQPLRARLLDPLSGHLDHMETVANQWEETATSLRAALDARDDSRQRLRALRREDGAPGAEAEFPAA
jgi:hypothetical protein